MGPLSLGLETSTWASRPLSGNSPLFAPSYPSTTWRASNTFRGSTPSPRSIDPAASSNLGQNSSSLGTINATKLPPHLRHIELSKPVDEASIENPNAINKNRAITTDNVPNHVIHSIADSVMRSLEPVTSSSGVLQVDHKDTFAEVRQVLENEKSVIASTPSMSAEVGAPSSLKLEHLAILDHQDMVSGTPSDVGKWLREGNLVIMDHEDAMPGAQPATKSWLTEENLAAMNRAEMAPERQPTCMNRLVVGINSNDEDYQNNVQANAQPESISMASIPSQFDHASKSHSISKIGELHDGSAGWMGKAGKLDISADEGLDGRFPLASETAEADSGHADWMGKSGKLNIFTDEETAEKYDGDVSHLGKARDLNISADKDCNSLLPLTLKNAEPNNGDAGWVGKAGKLDTADEGRNKRYPCSFENCLKAYDTKRELRHHKKDVHDYCSICKIDFPNWDAYHEHKVTSKAHITCPLCSADFATADGRNRHSKTMHPKAQNLACVGCGEPFIRGSELISHMEENRCDSITKEQFTRSRLLYSILKRQLDEKLSSGAVYEQESHVDNNIKSAPGATLPLARQTHMERLSRMMMGDETAERRHAKQHERFLRNLDIETCRDKLGSYTCPYGGCSKQYKKPHLLMTHLRSDAHRPKRITCPSCFKKFATIANIISHFESPTTRCKIQKTACLYQDALEIATGGFLGSDGAHEDGTKILVNKEPLY